MNDMQLGPQMTVEGFYLNKATDVVDKAERFAQAIELVQHEVGSATAKFPPFNSAHEGYAVLLEEVDELWEIVKLKQKNRDLSALRKEAVQVAAMAIRFLTDICNEEMILK
jgi:hypothetical protein